MNLARAYLEGLFKKIPDEIDLIFSRNHLIFKKKPWIVHIEDVTSLTGLPSKHFNRYKRLVETCLASSYCKKILTWSEVARRSIFRNLDCTEFEHKIEILPLAVHKKNFNKSYNDEKIKLLFVGTVNADVPWRFEVRGGKEVLEAFSYLIRRFDNLELTIRSAVPQATRTRYESFPNIKWIEKTIPWHLLEQEFLTADIFLLPSHHTPWSVILDAASYELPVIVTDVFANPELVEDGVTGFVIKKSEKVPYYWENHFYGPSEPQRRQFVKAVQTVDPKVVQELVEKTSILIENQELRRRMGRAARWEVEHGKFSIERRNEVLKRIFDEATGSSCQ